MIGRPLLLAAIGLVAALPAMAEGPPSLRLPLECEPGRTCWIMNYVDDDPGPAARDFRCGGHSYQGHGGTDFAVRDRKTMDAGVPVVAVASGRVIQVRDGETDGAWIGGGRQAVLDARHECGNRVALDLGGGWLADYCHMRKGSVAVKLGDQVQAGQRLGLVGLSGMTEYPHVHLGIIHGGADTDPFTGLPATAGCGLPGHALWASPLPYMRSSLFATGFADHSPSADEIRNDASSAATLPASAPVMMQWVALFVVDAGTAIRLRLTAPDGRVVADDRAVVGKDQALGVFAMPRKPVGGRWQPGTYHGEVTVTPPGDAAQTLSASIEVSGDKP